MLVILPLLVPHSVAASGFFMLSYSVHSDGLLLLSLFSEYARYHFIPPSHFFTGQTAVKQHLLHTTKSACLKRHTVQFHWQDRSCGSTMHCYSQIWVWKTFISQNNLTILEYIVVIFSPFPHKCFSYVIHILILQWVTEQQSYNKLGKMTQRIAH